jgi:SAM-dependent methyltransferase
MQILTTPLRLSSRDFRILFQRLGPSLGFWRAAEIAAFREQTFEPPILDLGCGDGMVTYFFLPHVEIGLDPDADALEKAAALGMYDQLEPSAMEHAAVEPGSISTVVSNSVLEHIPHIDDALAAAARALRPGGRLIFTCPTEHFSRTLTLPGEGYAARRNRHFQHLNLWPLEEWGQRLERVGLQVECVRPYLRPAWVRAWDALELLQMVHIGKARLFGRVWRRLPPAFLRRLARSASRINLAAHPPGGGRLIAARKM